MTGHTEAILNFDNFVQHNYNKLYVHALVQTHNKEQATDLLHTTYLKIKTFIIASGYTSQQFITHFCKSITNTYIDSKRKKKYEFVPEEILSGAIDENDSEDQEERQREREYLCKHIFKYIENKYDERQCYVFRIYFLYPPSCRMTYAKISEQTGLGISYCSETIKAIREDLKLNLFKYIEENGIH